MLSEKKIMKIMSYEKKIAIKILSICFELNVTEIITAGILVTTVANITLSLIYKEIDNLGSFMLQILLALTVLSTGVRLHRMLRTQDPTREIHNKVTEVDVHLNTNMSSISDPELFALLGLVIWILISVTLWCFRFLFSCGNNTMLVVGSLANISLALGEVPLIRAVALKQLIVKRLRQVASDDRLHLELTVSCTRQLIVSNSDVNNKCWMQALVCAITLFHQCLNFLYASWLQQVGKTGKVVGAFELCPGLTTSAHSGLYMVILLLAVYSSRVRDQLEEIQLKLDWFKNGKEISVQEKEMFYNLEVQDFLTPVNGYILCLVAQVISLLQKFALPLMSLFAMELHHARVALSAKGLFEFNKTTIVAVIGALISYELVLIQFS